MAYDANETLWRPGRVHVGDEVETEIATAFGALANNTVRESDFSPRAALAPWNFAQGASVGAPNWIAHRVTVPLITNGWVRIGGEMDCGMLRRPLTRFWVRMSDAGAPVLAHIDVELHEVTPAGVDTIVASVAFDPFLVLWAEVAIAGVTIGRRSRLYVRAAGDMNPSSLVRRIVCGARMRRYWVA